MKISIKTTILGALLVLSGTAYADFSANIGWQSDYYFRGVFQKSSSAQGGLDFEKSGFYVGVWGADVGGGFTGDGLEIDYYLGYGGEAGDFAYGIGYTAYTYTGDFDDTYTEINLTAGWSWLTFDAAIGTYDNFAGPDLDYQFYSLTAEYNGFYGVVGTFADDFEGSYFEAGYGNTLTVGETDIFDYTFTGIYSDSDLAGGSSDANLILTLSKTFDL